MVTGQSFTTFVRHIVLNLTVIGWWENTNILDTDIHKWLKKQPTINKHAEWFSHDVDLYVLKDQIEKQFILKDSKQKIKFNPRPYQVEFIQESK
jgi:hypothetical protein